MGLRRIILDVLIPLEVSIVDLSERISNIKGVEAVDINIKEIERKVETTVVTIEGKDFDYGEVKEHLETSGASIQNIDRVSTGKRLIV